MIIDDDVEDGGVMAGSSSSSSKKFRPPVPPKVPTLRTLKEQYKYPPTYHQRPGPTADTVDIDMTQAGSSSSSRSHGEMMEGSLHSSLDTSTSAYPELNGVSDSLYINIALEVC